MAVFRDQAVAAGASGAEGSRLDEAILQRALGSAASFSAGNASFVASGTHGVLRVDHTTGSAAALPAAELKCALRAVCGFLQSS